MTRFPLDPRLNVRCFPGPSPASAAAAQEWLGAPLPEGAWTVLCEGWSGAGAPGLAQTPGRDGRGGFSGSFEALAGLGEEVRLALEAARGCLQAPGRPLVMGILNVTPDSFSDGGLWIDAGAAVERGLQMLDEGADILDIGGESTRPGAEEVPAAEELRRILPVVTGLRARTGALLSIDTRKSEVAAPCLDAGADWINDVSGLTFDPGLADLAAARPGCRLVLMHCRARPEAERYSTEWDAPGRPVYDDVVADSLRWLRRQATHALERGVRPEQLWLDPGFGFGKTYEQNLDVLRRLREYTSAGLPLLVGTSRKSSVGKLVGGLPPDQRLEGTAATVAWSVAEGAAGVRVHDVKEMARIARAVHALRSGPGPESGSGGS